MNIGTETQKNAETSSHRRLEYPEPPHFLHSINPAPLQTLQSTMPFSCFILPSLQNTHFVPPRQKQQQVWLFIRLLNGHKLNKSHDAQAQNQRVSSIHIL